MANNYCESSSKLALPVEKLEKAKAIVARVTEEFEANPDEGYFGAEVQVEGAGVWFCHDESANPDHIETMAKTLLDELELDEPFVFSWSYTCSKPRLNEFGGGACVVQRGQPSMWFDAQSLAENYVRDGIDVYRAKELLEALEQILQADGDLNAMDFDQARAAVEGARRRPHATS